MPRRRPAGGFCKHAVATLLVLADEVTIEPELLDDVALRAGSATRPAPSRRPDAADRRARRLLAAPAPLPDSRGAATAAGGDAAGRHGDDVAAVLADALSVLRSR